MGVTLAVLELTMCGAALVAASAAALAASRRPRYRGRHRADF